MYKKLEIEKDSSSDSDSENDSKSEHATTEPSSNETKDSNINNELKSTESISIDKVDASIPIVSEDSVLVKRKPESTE